MMPRGLRLLRSPKVNNFSLDYIEEFLDNCGEDHRPDKLFSKNLYCDTCYTCWKNECIKRWCKRVDWYKDKRTLANGWSRVGGERVKV